MTLVSVLVRDALRVSNILSIKQDPTAEQMDEGVRALNRLISSSFGNEMGEQLDPLPIGQNNIVRPQGYPWYNQTPDWNDWFVPPNTRLVLNLDAPLTVYLDPNPMDGARFAIQDTSNNLDQFPLTVAGNGRLLDSLTQEVFDTPGVNKEFFYRQDTGNWAVLSPLLETDAFPFPTDFEDLFIFLLAKRLNPAYGVGMDAQTVDSLRVANNQFKARYRQKQFVPSELGLIRLPGARRRYYDNTRFGNSAFNSGYAYPTSTWPFVI